MIAMMFSDFENKLLDTKWPFDVLIYSSDVKDEFTDERAVIEQAMEEQEKGTQATKNSELKSSDMQSSGMKSSEVKGQDERANHEKQEYYIYRIYTDGNDQANTWMYANLSDFGHMYLNEDGSVNKEAVKKQLETNRIYCRYDTYMGISDYNHLRKMLGVAEISLGEDEYAIQVKTRIRSDVDHMPEDICILDAQKSEMLKCAGIYSDSLSQDGHNGGDYLLIVSDAVIETMQPYYSEMAVNLSGSTPVDLQRKLELCSEGEDEELLYSESYEELENRCMGSDSIGVYCGTCLVRDNLIPEMKYLLSALIVPGFYIGLVFLCVALTVLSVHQLSDSDKYKRRYDILEKIGLERPAINKLIGKQLMAYYLCPAFFAMLISGKVILQISKSFIDLTGVHTTTVQYFGTSVLLFFGIYLVYFLATYVGIKRSIYH